MKLRDMTLQEFSNRNDFYIYIIDNNKVEKLTKVKFMQKFYKASDAKAKKVVKQGETRRSGLYKKFGKEDYDQPYLYHLVLNMSRLSLEQASKEVRILIQQ